MLSTKIGGRTAATLMVAAFAVVTGGPALAASSTAQDETWIVAAHQSNLAEIAAGKDAQDNATSADIKDLGAMFVKDHTTLDKTVQDLATKYDVDLPDEPNAEQKAALAKTKANSGDAYDTTWVQTQTTGHLKTKAATKKELADGSAQDVLAAATTATPVVQHHIDELGSIATDLGITVPTSVSAGTGGQAAVTSHDPAGITLLVGGMIALLAALVMFRRRALAPAGPRA